MSLSVIVLAAGRGSRMLSTQPKVLHRLAGRPLLQHVITASGALMPSQLCIVYGYQGEKLKNALANASAYTWVLQESLLGTGHAVMQALPHIQEDGQVLVLCGDVPLIKSSTLTHLVKSTPHDAVGMITCSVSDPKGLGRILRNEKGEVSGIVEEKDASPTQRQINEINTGIFLFPAKHLKQWLKACRQDNQQGEYYLTDLIGFAVQDGVAIHTVRPTSEFEVQGVNNQKQLAALERYFQQQQADKLLQEGVQLADPSRVDVRGALIAGDSVFLDINVVIEGTVKLGDGVTVEPNVILRDCVIGDRAHIKANSVVEQATVGDDCQVGPFARLRPGVVMGSRAKAGNFVELKKCVLGEGSKVNHLSYIGDAKVGQQVNIGAGTITCNYDGVNKYETVIQDKAFIGSGTQLVAPVTVGRLATVGAGTTLLKDAPEGQLTINRKTQKVYEGWARPTKTQMTEE